MAGPPGSGKSTFGKQLKQNGYVIVSRDKVRIDLKKRRPNASEDDVWDWVLYYAGDACSRRQPVAIDATFSNPARRISASRHLREYGATKVTALVMRTSVEQCLLGNSLRAESARIPDTEVVRVYKQFWSQPPQGGVDGIDEVMFID